MFVNYKKALLMCNNLKGCQKDVEKLEKILNNFSKEVKITKKIDCYPKDEIIKFLQNVKSSKDSIYIHYSGHGVKRGRKVNGVNKILTAWLNPDGSTVTSDEIDKLLSDVNCNIILTTDCCHSETFGNYYTGKSSFIFIGTSKLGIISKSSVSNGGYLVNLFEDFLKNNIEINITNLKNKNLIIKSFFI